MNDSAPATLSLDLEANAEALLARAKNAAGDPAMRLLAEAQVAATLATLHAVRALAVPAPVPTSERAEEAAPAPADVPAQAPADEPVEDAPKPRRTRKASAPKTDPEPVKEPSA